ncbi:hypothetical protein SAY86_020109 [Trapa natans]|uniref:Uncharacterized protein n=1 Tax=Trapa natans TaxID=22666 RepID=A0AAN7LMX3_TRANT|nr:hypothetical protein SAY86_020109 [Trapa natans]
MASGLALEGVIKGSAPARITLRAASNLCITCQFKTHSAFFKIGQNMGAVPVRGRSIKTPMDVPFRTQESLILHPPSHRLG